jgi:hypothetical protein
MERGRSNSGKLVELDRVHESQIGRVGSGEGSGGSGVMGD